MAQVVPVSQTQLKHELESLSWQIVPIDLRLQQFRQQCNIHRLEAAKVELQKQIVDKQITLELWLAEAKKARR